MGIVMDNVVREAYRAAGEWCEYDDCPNSICGGPHFTRVIGGIEMTSTVAGLERMERLLEGMEKLSSDMEDQDSGKLESS
jgi:hypothetical protein